LSQHLAAVAHETGAQQQVARQVSHQRQLGRNHQVGVQLPGAGSAFDNALGIAARSPGVVLIWSSAIRKGTTANSDYRR